jgi:hypothetical protein
MTRLVKYAEKDKIDYTLQQHEQKKIKSTLSFRANINESGSWL